MRTRWRLALAAVLIVGAFHYTNADTGIGDAATGVLGTLRGNATTHECARQNGTYTGLHGCRTDGEITTVAHVIDGDTLTLTDGREIQLIGIDAPEPGDCAATTATRQLRAHVEGERVELHREPGVDRDRTGRILAYLRYDGPEYADDIGHDLVTDGLAVPYPAYAGNPRYTANLTAAAITATATGRGIHDSTCHQHDVQRPDRQPDRQATTRSTTPPTTQQDLAPQPERLASSPTTYFPDCAAARAAGQAPLRRGEPGYRPELDRGDDGVACET